VIKSRIVISRFFWKRRRKLNFHKYTRFSAKNILFLWHKFFTNTLHTNSNQFKKLINSKNEILYNFKYDMRGLVVSDRYNEVFIPRIRFKPGYQRIWRLARTAIKEALHLKYRYQYRLTRYLMKFSRMSHFYYLHFSENSIERVVMYSKLLPDTNSLNFFFNSQLLYINGRVVHDLNNLVAINDIIQLVISQWYYVFYRWLMNWTITRTRKFKRLVFRKNRPNHYKLMKKKKQRSRYTPNWIFNVRYDLIDVRPNLEVDYFTLSVFYLYEPYLINIFPINDLSEKRHNIYRLYNWKYIT
jgi:hypothetical protein